MNVCELLGCVAGYIAARSTQYDDGVTEPAIHVMIGDSSAITVNMAHLDISAPISSTELLDFIRESGPSYSEYIQDVMCESNDVTVPDVLDINRFDPFGQLVSNMYKEFTRMIADGEVTVPQRKYIKAIQWMLIKVDEDLLARVQHMPH